MNNGKMIELLLICLNLVYLPYVLFISIVYELFFPFYLLYFILSGKGRLDDAFRIHNWAYGYVMVKASCPILKVNIEGLENIPPALPVVAVFNHRSYSDIFFTAMLPIPNMLIVVRDWPFKRLWGLNIFMKLANYVNIEKMNSDGLLKMSRAFAARKVSFQFFPEGHRSKDGNLQRFKSGAFLVAFENNIPVIPVCMSGIDKFQRDRFPFIHPATVSMKILPCVYPDQFSGDMKTLEMRKYVKKMFTEALAL